MASDILMKGQPDPSAPGTDPLYGDPDEASGALMGDISTPEGHKKVAGAAIRLWKAKDRWINPELCQSKVNCARRKGIANAKVYYSASDDMWDTYFPHTHADITPNDRKLATTLRRLTSAMLTDPPAPLVEPPSGDDEDEDAAEFAERVLLDLQSESNLGTQHAIREAFDKASDFGSGFIHYYADEYGGGKQPITVEASVEPGVDQMGQPLAAQTAEETLQEVNPRTGVPWAGPFVERFVRPDGSLTDDEAEAATKWIRSIKRDILTLRNVRPIPHTAKEITECEGVQIGLFLPWSVVSKFRLATAEKEGEEQSEMPQTVADIPKEERDKILTYRPEHAKDLVPAGTDVDEEFDDVKAERLCFVLRTYYEQCPDYPEGLHLLTLADCYVVHRDKWLDDTDGARRKALIPLVQLKQWSEGRDNFYGTGTGEILGSPHEIRYMQTEAWLDHLERFNNPHIFLPYTSLIKAEDFQKPRGSVLYYNGGAGAPVVEQIREFSSSAQEMYNEQGIQMDLAAGLNDQPIKDSESGRQAYALLAQSHAGLAELRQNIETAYTRACRIELMMARLFLDSPQQMKWEAEGGRYKRKRWLASDLLATYDIRIKPGTMTMLSPAGKAQFVEHYMGLGLLAPDEAKERLTSSLGPLIGWRDDEYRMRVRGQIAEHKEGPPEGWQPPQGPVDQFGQPAMQPDPATGMLVPVPPPPDPVLMKMWAPVPSDQTMTAAQVRYDQIARYMQTPTYQRWPQEWRIPVDQEFMRMQQILQMAAQPAPEPGGEQPNKSSPTRQNFAADRVREGVPPEIGQAA